MKIEDLTDKAWSLLEEAICHGKMTLGGESQKLSTDQIVELVKWLTTQKVKKPDIPDNPDDYQPPETRDDDSDDETEIL